MANLLKMAIIETIRTLHRRGWSQRRIAAELGINRETVARYLRQADSASKPATAPTGSDDEPASQNQPMRPPARMTSPRVKTSHRAHRLGVRRRPSEQVIATPASVPDRPSLGRRQPVAASLGGR